MKIKKSNHKHIYNECLLETKEHIFRAEYCKICGKIKQIYFFEIIPSENGMYSIWKSYSKEEMKNIFYGLPIFEINDIYKEKFISYFVNKEE